MDTVLRKCCKVVLKNKDIAHLDGFVSYCNPSSSTGSATCVGRVVEILADVSAGMVLGILIQPYQVGNPCVLPYRFPSLSPVQTVELESFSWCKIQNCLSTVSTIHNCAAHGCTPTASRPVIQERHITNRFDHELLHVCMPHDILMNLAQLRSASLIQTFQPPARYPNLSRTAVVFQAVQNNQLLLTSTDGEELEQRGLLNPMTALSASTQNPRPKRKRNTTQSAALVGGASGYTSISFVDQSGEFDDGLGITQSMDTVYGPITFIDESNEDYNI